MLFFCSAPAARRDALPPLAPSFCRAARACRFDVRRLVLAKRCPGLSANQTNPGAAVACLK